MSLLYRILCVASVVGAAARPTVAQRSEAGGPAGPGPGGSGAGEVGRLTGPDTLDLGHAIAWARANNPSLAAATAEVAAATARIRPAGTLPDPTVTLGAMNYMLPTLSASRDPLSMTQLTVMQLLPVNGTLGLRRTVARFDSARVAHWRDGAVLQVERDVRAKYWDLYHTDRALEVMARTLGVTRRLADIATTMYAVGGTVQSDVVRAQVAITRMQQEITEMQLRRYAAASAFNALLGRPGDAPVVVPSPAAHEAHGQEIRTLDMPAPPSLDSLVALAEEGNPDLLAARAAVAGAGANETAVRRMIYPDLGLGLAYGQRVGDNDMVSAMVSVSLPVFAASRQFRMRDEARAMRSAAEQGLSAVRLEVRSGLATAHAEAETARRLVALYAGSLVPQANAGYEAALAAYRVGRVDFPAVLDAQMALLAYQHDLHRYEAMYGTAIADLDRLSGRTFVAPARNQ